MCLIDPRPNCGQINERTADVMASQAHLLLALRFEERRAVSVFFFTPLYQNNLMISVSFLAQHRASMDGNLLVKIIISTRWSHTGRLFFFLLPATDGPAADVNRSYQLPIRSTSLLVVDM